MLEGLQESQSGLLSSADHAASVAHGWSVPRRLEFSRSIEENSVIGAIARSRWDQAIAAIEASSKYEHLKLQPQLGLLPLGPDPRSGLWEFLHLGSGAEPTRDESGSLIFDEPCGIVLVLVPGGHFKMGGRKGDNLVEAHELPLHAVTLSPYFLGKYEMSQRQWMQLGGHNPAYFKPKDHEFIESLLHPVEAVSWHDARTLLAHHDLRLPTEAEWEFATRGLTETRWWTGDTPQELGIAQATSLSQEAWKKVPGGESFTDPFVVHGPVTALAPNPFGFHMLLGNVFEWCEDSHHYYTRDSCIDPCHRSSHEYKATRGSAHSWDISRTRTTSRKFELAHARLDYVGVRAARSVKLDS